jgi:drug/metabolite transporter (DMT)-like permease
MRASMSDTGTLPRSTWWLLAVLTLGWGMNWPMIKLGLMDIPVWTFRAGCVGAGAVGLLSIARFSGLRIAVPKGEWPALITLSLFNVTLWNVLVSYGVKVLPAGRSAILAYTMPLWTVLLSALFLGEKLTVRRIAGIALGMGGLALLLANEFTALEAAPLGALLIVGAALSWATGTLLMKRFPSALPTLSFSGWNMLLGGIPIAIGAVVIEHSQWRPVGLPSAIGLVYNMIVAFIVCYTVWFKIVRLAPAGVSALGTLMIPVVAVFSSMVILGERPRWSDLAALALVIAALATVLIPARPRTET